MKTMKESYWILTFALVVLAICLVSDRVELVEGQVSEEFVGPEACITCHPSQYEGWEESGHSQAFTNTEFQEQWDSEGNPENCLECHTTGFDSTSGEYASENVSCESCHGAGYTMEVNRTSELCGSCHSGEYGKNRYEDFLEGTHATSGVVCADCHVSEEDHSLELVSDACATCHTGERIHSSGIMGELQARALTAEEITEQVQAEHDALVNEISETEKRTQLITLMTYAGAGGLVAVSLVIGLLYMKQKQPQA